MKIHILSHIFILSLLLSGCSKSDSREEKQELAQNIVNVSYGTHDRNKLDVYLPAGHDENTKVLVLLHGGSWVDGDKSSITDYAKYFRDKGYAAIAINYRLAHTAENNIHPAQINDIEQAIDFISSKAAEWKISGDKFGLLGASAGGHLALLDSYADNQDGKVKIVISVAGPTNLTDPRNVRPELVTVAGWFIGSTIQENPEAYVQASPITYVTASTVPTLLVHGKNDLLVPYQQAIDLQEKLEKYSVPNKLILYENAGHEVIDEANRSEFLNECEAWFQAYLK